MKNGDIIIDFQDKTWLLIDIDTNSDNQKFLLVVDFKTQRDYTILLNQEVKKVVPKPLNVEFMVFHWREKELSDVKGYL